MGARDDTVRVQRGHRAVAATGHLLRLALLAWLAFVGFLLVAVVGMVASGTSGDGTGGSVAVVLAGTFAGTLVAWAGARRRLGRPLHPDKPTVEEPAFPRDLFARNGSLHPNSFAVLLARGLVALTLVALGATLVGYVVVADPTGVAVALVLAATTVALWVATERTAFAWTLSAAGGGVQFRAVVGDAPDARRLGRRVAAESRRAAVACRLVARGATERVADASGRERREKRR